MNDDDDSKLDRKGGSPMTPSENRISNLEDDAFNAEHEDNFRIVLALCEIARQLARIADTFAIRIGLGR